MESVTIGKVQCTLICSYQKDGIKYVGVIASCCCILCSVVLVLLLHLLLHFMLCGIGAVVALYALS